MAQPTRLLVASIGNPSPYLSTLHSAGHTVLHSLAKQLSLPPFAKSRAYANGLLSTSAGTPYTLWQSPSLMNISGSSVNTAWKAFVAEHGRHGDVKLVVLHDELELALGQVKVKAGKGASPKGHNGLKSIREKMPEVEYTRIGIGIGRPDSREPGVVADYVLRKCSPVERMKLEGCVGRVAEELARLAG